MPAPDLLTSAERASKIHHLDGGVPITTLDTTLDSDRFVIDRRAADGTWANKQISATDVAAQLATPPTPVPAEDSIQDGSVIEIFDDYDLGAISAFNKGTGWLNDGVGSGCTIVSRTQSDGRVHKRLEINAGQYGRTFPFGKYWNRIKICVLWRLNHNATINPVDGYLGLCSGTANMVASASTDNFIGLRWGDGASACTFTAGTLINYFQMGVSFRTHSRRGTTSTLVVTGGSGHTVSAAEGYLSGIMYEVSRNVQVNDSSSVQYTHKEVSPQSGLVEFSRPKELIKSWLAVMSTTAASLSDLETATIGTLGGGAANFDQSTGGLDTVNISWPQSSGLEIAAIGVRKVH